jgi:hypothetical protein
MFRPLKHALAALLLLCAPLAHAADIKPLVNSSGSIRPVHTGETVGVANGGTGATTLTAHCVILGNGTTAPTVACPGSSGNVLTSNGSSADPTFQAGAAGTVTTTGSPASGNLAKFSGSASITNGDLSGDVTTSGGLAATIPNDTITYAKMQNVSAASRIIGRGSASGSGDPEELSLGTGLTLSGTTLSANPGSGAVGSEVLISEQTPSGTGTVSFTSIPATYRDLVVRVRGAGTTASTTVNINATLNNDAAAHYHGEILSVSNGATNSISAINDTHVSLGNVPGSTATAGSSAYIEMTIGDYRGTTFNKEVFVHEGWRSAATGTGVQVGIIAYNWADTSAVNRVDVIMASGSFATGTVVSLYGRF